MEELINLLQNYPKTGGTTIAVICASLGWISRNIFQLILDNYKHKKELKTYLWKEKINAGKKASEFYLEYLNLLNLGVNQFEMYEFEKEEHRFLIENIQNEVKFFMDKLKMFPHFEYHHINIFYEFEEKKTADLINENNKIFRKLAEIDFSVLEIEDEIKFQTIEVRKYLKKLKENYIVLIEIHKKHINEVRLDIKKYL